MAVYDYECINKQGEIIRGQINGENFSSVLGRLKAWVCLLLTLRNVKHR